jgi:hypothetical protein
MKKNIFLLLILITGFWGEVAAHDFWAVNSDGDTLYYNITSSVAPYTVEVTYKGTIYYQYDDEYIGDINIPSTVSRQNITYSVTAIGRNAFDGCDLVTTVHIPSSVTLIDSYLFYHCTSLRSVTLPDSILLIHSYAFGYCTALDSLIIPQPTQAIISYAFDHCSSLYSITLPVALCSIGNYAFMKCDSLFGVTIPANVTTIGDSAFALSGLQRLTLLPVVPPAIGEYTFHRVSDTIPIIVPCGSVSAYQSADS